MLAQRERPPVPPDLLRARVGVGTRPPARRRVASPFSRVLCAVDGSRGSREAVEQAIALALPGGSILFMTIRQPPAGDRSTRREPSEIASRTVLERAESAAHRAGLEASIELLRNGSAGDALLAEAEGHDLIVLGGHGGSRLGGIPLGSTAREVAGTVERPLLIARRSADGRSFPRSILLATDGSAGSWAAARTATRLGQSRGSELRLVHVPDGTPAERRNEILKQLAVIEKATGGSPTVVGNPGRVAERVGAAARAGQSSLIVVGRGGGPGALGRVSEQLVRRAPCSVLAVPAG